MTNVSGAMPNARARRRAIDRLDHRHAHRHDMRPRARHEPSAPTRPTTGYARRPSAPRESTSSLSGIVEHRGRILPAQDVCGDRLARARRTAPASPADMLPGRRAPAPRARPSSDARRYRARRAHRAGRAPVAPCSCARGCCPSGARRIVPLRDRIGAHRQSARARAHRPVSGRSGQRRHRDRRPRRATGSGPRCTARSRIPPAVRA